jgi:hypothetical protein
MRNVYNEHTGAHILCRFIELKRADAMLSVIEKYVDQIRENRKRLNEDGVENASIIIFNISLNGSIKSEDMKTNLERKEFEENNKFNRLVGVCNFLISQQPSSPEQKRITDHFRVVTIFL